MEKSTLFRKRRFQEEATEGNVIKKGITGKYSMDTDEELLRKHRMEKMNEKEEKVIVEPSIDS